MKTIDMRFDQSLIQGWIGKRFIKYKNDDFVSVDCATIIVGLYIGEEVFIFTNEEEEVDYFGTIEDIAVSKLCKSEDVSVKSYLAGVEMVPTSVDKVITSVKVVNELQKMAINGMPAYEVWLTRAIIIEVGDSEILFEKEAVPFSEQINIRRGSNLLEQVSDNDDFLETWDASCTPEYSREVIEIR